MIRRPIAHYNTLNDNRSHAEQSIYSEFGRRLQARMIQLGWNQSELSRRATEYLPKAAKGQVQGVTLGRDRISSYIRGKYLPRPEALTAIARALKCKASDLLPAEVVPSVDGGLVQEFKSVGNKRSAIRLMRVVSDRCLAKITAALNEEDGLL